MSAASAAATTPHTLSQVLAPLSENDFFNIYLGNEFFYSKGWPGKFAGLLPWPDLNQILRHHDLDAPRLRLVQEGKPVPPENYTTYINSRKPGSRRARLRAPELTNCLQKGATLIIDSLDEIQEPVTQLAEELERSLRTRIQVNMYAGWRTSRGFDVHRDSHDVLILQVSGRKRWAIYGFSREPSPSGDGDHAPKEPVWESTLEDGDLLYIPRGCWHVAFPMDEPTLHLTVGLHHATGADFIDWFVSRLRTRAVLRQDLPRFRPPEEQAEYLNRVWSALAEAWHPGVLNDYLSYADGRSSARPHFGLPWTASASALPAGHSGWSVEWIVPRPVDLENDANGAIRIACAGKQWTFAAAARPLLDTLQRQGMCRIDELYAISGDLGRDAVHAFLNELLEAGLVALAHVHAE